MCNETVQTQESECAGTANAQDNADLSMVSKATVE